MLGTRQIQPKQSEYCPCNNLTRSFAADVSIRRKEDSSIPLNSGLDLNILTTAHGYDDSYADKNEGREMGQK